MKPDLGDRPAGEPAKVIPHPRGLDGTLTTPAGEELPVRTFERGSDAVLVVLVDRDEERRTERMESAMLEYNSVRGVVRMRGAAVFEDRALIRFEAEDAAEVMQRRQFVRVQAPRPIALAAGEEPDAAAEPGAGEAPIGAHTIDLSGGGMLISGAHELAEGDTVRFSMTLGHGETPIAGMARVVRVRDDGRRALTFEQIDERDRQRLIRYIFECMRTARAKTRGDLM